MTSRRSVVGSVRGVGETVCRENLFPHISGKMAIEPGEPRRADLSLQGSSLQSLKPFLADAHEIALPDICRCTFDRDMMGPPIHAIEDDIALAGMFVAHAGREHPAEHLARWPIPIVARERTVDSSLAQRAAHPTDSEVLMVDPVEGCGELRIDLPAPAANTLCEPLSLKISKPCLIVALVSS